MLFLLNDVIFNVDLGKIALPVDGAGVSSLKLDQVMKLGGELYAAEPLLHQTHPDRARRLAALITIKAPQINAALFIAPAKYCRPDEVSCRYAGVSFDVLGALWAAQQDGRGSTVETDRQVWRRLAA